MAEAERYPRPMSASDNCRHYSFSRSVDWMERGPRCACGVDISKPGAAKPCFSPPTSSCSKREEFTDAERAAWQEYIYEGLERLKLAIGALPAALPEGTSGTIICPNCGGTITYARWRRGAELNCDTPNCCGAHLSIEAGAEWPKRTGGDRG